MFKSKKLESNKLNPDLKSDTNKISCLMTGKSRTRQLFKLFCSLAIFGFPEEDVDWYYHDASLNYQKIPRDRTLLVVPNN